MRLPIRSYKEVFFFLAGVRRKRRAGCNRRLSERRAQAVRDFLIQNFRSRATLVAAGYGKEQLKNSADPFAAQNRRVQVTICRRSKKLGNEQRKYLERT